MQVHCDTCSAMVRADDVNLATGLARCRFCHSVFRLPDALAGSPTAGETDPDLPAPRTLVPRPPQVTVRETAGQLVLDRRWFGWRHVFLFCFALVWCAFLAFWYAIALVADGPGQRMMLILPILHVAVGVGIMYTAVAGFLNHTRVTLGGGILRVAHGPLPWPGNRTLRAESVEQLFCDEVVTRGRNGTQISYRLNAALRDGTRQALLSGIDQRDVPLFMEHRMEGWLAIADQPVAGELRR